jgi:predicted Zn finger-like uncharacterized protein
MAVLSVLLILSGAGLVIIGGFVSDLLFFVGFVPLFAGSILLIYWSTVKYIWECPQCKTRFTINLFENILGLNSGRNEKTLRCPNCQKKASAKAIV